MSNWLSELPGALQALVDFLVVLHLVTRPKRK